MTIVSSRPGPSPTELARIGRRMGGTRNEVNETAELLPSSTTSLTSKPVVESGAPSNHAHNDPNAPVPGKPAIVVAKPKAAAHTPPPGAQTHGTAHPGLDPVAAAHAEANKISILK